MPWQLLIPCVQAKYADAHFEVDLDCTGMSIVPGASRNLIEKIDLMPLAGFVDAHTHPVWAGDRVHEFAMKLAGATYMDIHNAGGGASSVSVCSHLTLCAGIGFTVKHTREASEQQLLENFLQRARRMLAQGTTTLEAKSGYGLDTDTEMKMLRVRSARLTHLSRNTRIHTQTRIYSRSIHRRALRRDLPVSRHGRCCTRRGS